MHGRLEHYAYFRQTARKDLDGAEALYQRAIEADPKDGPDRISYAALLGVRGDFVALRTQLDEAELAAIAKVYDLLKPGGVFVSSTACIADMRALLRFILPVGRLFGLVPFVKVFTEKRLIEDLTAAGFEVAHHWLPGKGKAVFVVARRRGDMAAPSATRAGACLF